VVFGKGVGANGAEVFSEASAKNSGIGFPHGEELMRDFMASN